MERKKNLIIIQARYSSSRLPGKVLLNIFKNIPALKFMISRLTDLKNNCKCVIAIPDNTENLILENFLKKNNFPYFKGDEMNVLKRFYQCSLKFNPNAIVRLTADCPLVDSTIVDKCIDMFFAGSYDYFTNTNPATFPDGLDVEIFSHKLLCEANEHAYEKYDLEHVTPWMRKNASIKKGNYLNDVDYSTIRWTLDNNDDFIFLKEFIKYFPNSNIKFQEMLKIYLSNNSLRSINSHYIRNYGME